MKSFCKAKGQPVVRRPGLNGRYELILIHLWADAVDLCMVFLASCPLSIYVKTAYRRYLPAPGDNAVVPLCKLYSWLSR